MLHVYTFKSLRKPKAFSALEKSFKYIGLKVKYHIPVTALFRPNAAWKKVAITEDTIFILRTTYSDGYTTKTPLIVFPVDQLIGGSTALRDRLTIATRALIRHLSDTGLISGTYPGKLGL